jgi:hypothetical protein
MVQDVRTVFLREFVREVIKQVPKKPEWTSSNYLVSLPQRIPLPKAPVIQTLRRMQRPLAHTNNLHALIQKKVNLVPPARIQKMPIPRPLQTNSSVKRVTKPEILVNAPPVPTLEGKPFPNTGSKILPLLRDPAVIGIECPGPDKLILVNQSGVIRPSQIKLSTEEIKAILDEVSTETKIPLIEGVFKTAYKVFMVTAVVSEFVGSRFVIEKRPRMPQNPINSTN